MSGHKNSGLPEKQGPLPCLCQHAKAQETQQSSKTSSLQKTSRLLEPLHAILIIVTVQICGPLQLGGCGAGPTTLETNVLKV